MLISPAQRKRWDLYKSTIEKFLIDGYAPVGYGLGKSAVVYAARHLLDTGQAETTGVQGTDFLKDWIKHQRKKEQAGEESWMPDWNLYAPQAARNGKLGYEPVLPGFEITETSTTTDAQGNLQTQRVTQKQSRGSAFEMPQGHMLKGVSAYMSSDGRLIGQWVKTREGDRGPEAIEAIKAVFAEYTGRAELCSIPAHVDEDLLTVYVIPEPHLGMYSWKDETGADYDLGIGERLLRSTTLSLVASSPSSHTGIILSLGDFFHTDSSANRTERSHNALDIDTRRAKVYKIGVQLMVTCIELALQKHKKVIVRCLPGNHDPETTPTLAIALWAFFHNDPRVEVDCSPSRFFHYQHGLTMISATHGDQCKIQNMPGKMAANQPDMWGATRFRYALGGHIHHKEKFCQEWNGAICETFESLAPPDAWAAGMGFGAGRSMTAIHYHREFGEDSRSIKSVR